MKFCKTCGSSTYKPKQRIYSKYCNLDCRNNDPEYWNAISKTKSIQSISEEQKLKISESLTDYYKNNPRKKKNSTNLYEYRADCAFKFALNDYPSEFDFSLVEHHGWYKAKNRGDNLYGVSRDHMVSVKYGFDNNIDPVIISHPANCRLVLHSENASKNSKNHITYEELLLRIQEWDNKYKNT